MFRREEVRGGADGVLLYGDNQVEVKQRRCRGEQRPARQRREYTRDRNPNVNERGEDRDSSCRSIGGFGNSSRSRGKEEGECVKKKG